MGFFDRFKKTARPQSQPAPTPAQPPAAPADAATPSGAGADGSPSDPLQPGSSATLVQPPPEIAAAISATGATAASAATPEATPAATPTAATPAMSEELSNASVKTLLLAACEKLRTRDLPGALAIYETLLRDAGDRADVLVTLSADLGTHGYIEQIVELVAPRYDAERHGPATGINLLQAYLAARNTTAAQHLLDILFALDRPELEERLHGFSNALAELIEAEKSGALAPPPSAARPDGAPAAAPAQKTIHLASISRPIWSYGLEAVPSALPPPKEGRLRRVAFCQLSQLGVTDPMERAAKPEDALARLTRGLPLWFAETFYFAPHYAPLAVVALLDNTSYAVFPIEWTTDNLRQLVSTSGDPIDYVFTGALRDIDDDCELTLRVWEVKKFRERKQFTARWTPATIDTALADLHATVCRFMEWKPCPGGPAYARPSAPAAWCDTLGASLSWFLADKQALPAGWLAEPAATAAALAARAASGERESLAWLTFRDRAARIGLSDTLPPAAPALAATPLVEAAKQSLGG
ncbi:MAG: hypothetical protein LBI02_11055 [Opitutaceae bacterium]|jgi:hypothetical protein|nr:hypothetical protein [Opitutaceae bacterium]